VTDGQKRSMWVWCEVLTSSGCVAGPGGLGTDPVPQDGLGRIEKGACECDVRRRGRKR
jgi:hypothetical protein